MARDYRAEYARRQANAQRAGYQSYWHRRETQRAARNYVGASRRQFIATSKDLPDGLTPARVRGLWAEGDEAMRAGDFERARRIAGLLGVEPLKPEYPPESLFWYH